MGFTSALLTCGGSAAREEAQPEGTGDARGQEPQEGSGVSVQGVREVVANGSRGKIAEDTDQDLVTPGLRGKGKMLSPWQPGFKSSQPHHLLLPGRHSRLLKTYTVRHLQPVACDMNLCVESFPSSLLRGAEETGRGERAEGCSGCGEVGGGQILRGLQIPGCRA